MNLLQILLLGVVQGLTEFLPVSSTGHLIVLQHIFEWGDTEKYKSLDIFLHLPTILAVLVFFRRDIAAVFRDLFAPRAPQDRHAASRLILMIIIGLISTAIVYFLFKKGCEEFLGKGFEEVFFNNVPLVGAAFIVTALFLAAVSFKREGPLSEGDLRISHALLIGIAQGIAITPGISRSGFTIIAALLIGMKAPAAFRFSFLLSIPTIILAWLYDALSEPGALSNLGGEATPLAATFVITFCLALLAVYILRGVILRNRLWLFSLYLIPFGLFTLLYFR
jgi:undecaprenyl-diphosphatase